VTPLEGRRELQLAPPKGTPATIRNEGLTLHYGGDSPHAGADRSTAERFAASIDHGRCRSIWRAWQSFHMAPVSSGGRGWNDIAYNAGFCPHGHRLEGRGVGIRSGANGTTSGNTRSCALVYIAGGSDPLTDAAKRAALDEQGRFGKPIRWNHSDWKPTTCAGPSIKTWQAAGWPAPTTGDDDMSAEAERKIDELYELFANRNPSFGAGTPPRWQVVLDNAIWNRERITTTYEGVIKVHELVEGQVGDVMTRLGGGGVDGETLSDQLALLIDLYSRIAEALEQLNLAR
jgi:hypothetical protein